MKQNPGAARPVRGVEVVKLGASGGTKNITLPAVGLVRLGYFARAAVLQLAKHSPEG